jgi:hypothetical protein
LAAACLIASPSAHAQTDDAKSRARESYARGEALTAEARWREAALAFAEADALAPNDVALEAALEAAIRAEDAPLAMNLCERTTRSEASSRLPSVEVARSKYASAAALLRIPCLEATPPCGATVDGVDVSSPRWWVTPGRRELRLQASGAAPVARTVDAVAGREHAVELEAARPEPKPPTSAADRADAGVSPWWLALPGGVTVASAVVFAVQGARASSLEGDLATLQTAGRPGAGASAGDVDAWVAEQQSLVDDGSAAATLSNVFLGVGAAAAVTTVVMAAFVVDWDGSSSGPPVGLVVSPVAGGGAAFFVGGSFGGL